MEQPLFKYSFEVEKRLENRLLERIVCHQLLNVSFESNLGIYNGRMGCVLFLYHYSRYTGNVLFAQFADELLDEICEKITANTSWNFSMGLAGIGWGIEYLAHCRFIEGDTNDILSEIDKKNMEYDVCRISNTSLEKGTEGLAWYILSRLMSQHKVGQPFDDVYLNSIRKVYENISQPNEDSGIHLLQSYFHGEKIIYAYLELLERILSSQNINSPIMALTWQRGLKLLLTK